VFPGGWRPVYKVALPVDTAGTLTDGTSFKDITGFREHLLANPDQIAENFAHHLLIYATGADLSYSDRADMANSMLKISRPTKLSIAGVEREHVQRDGVVHILGLGRWWSRWSGRSFHLRQ